MPLKWKVDVLAALKEKGHTSYTLRKNKVLSESTIQKLREGRGIAWEGVEQLCELLNCQPGDIMEFVEDSAGDAQQSRPALRVRSEESFCAAVHVAAGGRF